MPKTIVLDAGHGGYDFGAVNGARTAKDDNLRMALEVGRLLEACDFDVIYTRTEDVFVPLSERINISNKANADAFVSFQRGSATNPATNGFEVWVHPAASKNAVVMANYILDRVRAVGVQSSRGIQYGNFAVLRETKAPAVLIENGFISNAEDNRLFDENFYLYAQAIANGIARLFDVSCVPVEPPIVPPPPPTPPGTYERQVIEIQERLNSEYGANLVADGMWGPLSNRAMLRAYQTELNRMFGAGLAVDGIWGPRTRAATRIVRMGDTGPLVWILQSMLYIYGFTTTPDGVFGANTDLALRNFQRANGLAIDGLAGPITFETLFTSGLLI